MVREWISDSGHLQDINPLDCFSFCGELLLINDPQLCLVYQLARLNKLLDRFRPKDVTEDLTSLFLYKCLMKVIVDNGFCQRCSICGKLNSCPGRFGYWQNYKVGDFTSLSIFLHNYYLKPHRLDCNSNIFECCK